MSDGFWIFLIFFGGAACFVAGVIFHKYVISEAAAIKEHVTTEIAETRADVAALKEHISSLLSAGGSTKTK